MPRLRHADIHTNKVHAGRYFHATIQDILFRYAHFAISPLDIVCLLAADFRYAITLPAAYYCHTRCRHFTD